MFHSLYKLYTRDPNSPLTNDDLPEWPRYTLPEQEYKVLSLTFENGRALRMDKCAFWLNYAPTLYFQGLFRLCLFSTFLFDRTRKENDMPIGESIPSEASGIQLMQKKKKKKKTAFINTFRMRRMSARAPTHGNCEMLKMTSNVLLCNQEVILSIFFLLFCRSLR